MQSQSGRMLIQYPSVVSKISPGSKESSSSRSAARKRSPSSTLRTVSLYSPESLLTLSSNPRNGSRSESNLEIRDLRFHQIKSPISAAGGTLSSLKFFQTIRGQKVLLT